MSETAFSRPALGVGSIVGSAFAIFFGRFGLMFALAFVPAFLTELVPVFLLPGVAEEVAAGNYAGGNLIGMVVLIFLPLVLADISTALIVLAAFDVYLNRPTRPPTYVRSILANLLPIFILSVVSSLLVVLGFIAFVVPGLWIAAVWFVAIPAVVIEGAGFSALGRSANLTREYRWPLIGLLVILIVISGLTTAVAQLPQSFLLSAGGIWLALLARAVVSAVAVGVIAAATAMTYARLREIKEGIHVDSLADVFA